jgi:hypothetical protein
MELHYLRVYESSAGGWIDIHRLHGKEEAKENLKACKILADLGFSIELLPCLLIKQIRLRQQLLSDVCGIKNPDIRINGMLIGDIKTPNETNLIRKATINNAIGSAAIQKVELVIINLSKCAYAVQDVKKGIVGALQPDRNRSIRQIWIITNANKVFAISRQMVYNDDLYEELEQVDSQFHLKTGQAITP